MSVKPASALRAVVRLTDRWSLVISTRFLYPGAPVRLGYGRTDAAGRYLSDKLRRCSSPVGGDPTAVEILWDFWPHSEPRRSRGPYPSDDGSQVRAALALSSTMVKVVSWV